MTRYGADVPGNQKREKQNEKEAGGVGSCCCCCCCGVTLLDTPTPPEELTLGPYNHPTQLTNSTQTHGFVNVFDRLRRNPPPSSHTDSLDGWRRENKKGERGGEKTCLSLTLPTPGEGGFLCVCIRAPPLRNGGRSHTRKGRRN